MGTSISFEKVTIDRVNKNITSEYITPASDRTEFVYEKSVITGEDDS